ncbi:MAG TPA: response regulator transcription factor [Bacillota bacterium]
MQQIIDELYEFLGFRNHLMFFYLTVSYSIGLPSLVLLILAQAKTRSKALTYMVCLFLTGTLQLILNSFMEYQRVNLPYQVKVYELVFLYTLQGMVIIFLPLFVNEFFSVTYRRRMNRIFCVIFGIGLAFIFIPYLMGMYQGGTEPAFLGEKISIEELTSFKIYRSFIWSAYLYTFIVVTWKIKTVSDFKERFFCIGFFAILFLIFSQTAHPAFKSFPENLFVSASGNFFLNILLLKYLVDKFFTDFGVFENKSSSRTATEILPLTEREKEVLELLRQGLTNKRIGALLCISEPTVKSHIQNIYKKIGVNNRVQLINSLKNYL